jgi:hypothetical protein
MSDTEPRDAVLSQTDTIHHPTCSRVKDLKDPVKVTVTTTGIATLPTGGRRWAWTTSCCERHFRTKDVTISVWRDDE